MKMWKAWKALPKTIRAVLGTLMVLVLMAIPVSVYRIYNEITHPKVTMTNDVVISQLEKMQDLTTMRKTDYGFEQYQEGDIAFVNRKSFTMFYAYEVRAGIDLSKAVPDIDEENITITITLPEPTIQSVSVDPDSLRFFDEESPIFRSSEFADTAAALKDAKAHAEQAFNKDDLLVEANKQAKDVIEKMYEPFKDLDSYTVKVVTTEPKS